MNVASSTRPTPSLDPLFDDTHDIGLSNVDDEVENESLKKEGFCKDDIYTQYLKQQFVSQYKKRQNNMSSSSLTKMENKALFFAASKLTSHENPYFGAIPLVVNPQVEYWIRYFKTTGRTTFSQWLSRGEVFKEVLNPIFIESNMPFELIFLSMIESGFDTRAHSHKQAVGPWQFMKGTALLYGLKVNGHIDERRDPVKSTRAATAYLRKLYGKFGDWYLAFAAYNSGPRLIDEAISKAKSRDFWTLIRTPYLKSETKEFIPKLLAAMIIGSNPEKHGFEYAKL